MGLSEAWFPMDLYLKTICMSSAFSSRTYEVFDDSSITWQYQKHILFTATWGQGQAQRGKGINQPGWRLQQHYSGITAGSWDGQGKETSALSDKNCNLYPLPTPAALQQCVTLRAGLVRGQN